MEDDKTYKIIGAAMEVHKKLGCGFTEKVYQEALAHEFELRSIPFEREVRMQVTYKDVVLNSEYIPDFICYDNVIVELKAVQELDDIHRAQTINYLHVSNAHVALLINFGYTSLEYERFIQKSAKSAKSAKS